MAKRTKGRASSRRSRIVPSAVFAAAVSIGTVPALAGCGGAQQGSDGELPPPHYVDTSGGSSGGSTTAPDAGVAPGVAIAPGVAAHFSVAEQPYGVAAIAPGVAAIAPGVAALPR